jgi:hypothetical protein
MIGWKLTICVLMIGNNLIEVNYSLLKGMKSATFDKM